jgi:hypothetical protein
MVAKSVENGGFYSPLFCLAFDHPFGFLQDFAGPSTVPSGKHTKNYGKSPFLMENPL